MATAVWPDECMPTDKFGNRADYLQFGGSTNSRMNPGQLHEQLFGAAGRDVIKRIRRDYGLGDFEQLEFRNIVELLKNSPHSQNLKNYEYLLGWYEIIAIETDYPRAKRYLERGDRWMVHLAHVIEDGNEPYGTFIHFPADGHIDINAVIGKIKEGPYRPEMSTVRYKWPGDTEYTETVTEILLGPTYFLPLEKTATDWSGVGSCKVGHFGTTSRLTQSDRYSRPGRETSTRVAGEAEFRNGAKSYGGEWLAHWSDMNNNPVVHEEICRTLITHETPTNIDVSFDREKFPIGGHRPLSFLKHMSFCGGKGFSDK